MKKVQIIDLHRNIFDIKIKYFYPMDLFYETELFAVNALYCEETGKFEGFVIESNQDVLEKILSDDNLRNKIPLDLKAYRKKYPGVKFSNISFRSNGGNSSSNSLLNSLYIPLQWTTELGLSKENNGVLMEFDGERIIIRKRIE